MGLEQYEDDVNICCRCSCCKFIPMQKIVGHEYAYICPSISRYNYHSYSGGGRLDILAAGLKDGFKYNDRLLDIVYNCQLCGACGASCNYAMDMELQQPLEEFRIKCVEEGQTNPAKGHKGSPKDRFHGNTSRKTGRLGFRSETQGCHQREGRRALSRWLPHQLR